jgi:O-antigen/teichoic acid export membrane protein
LPLAGMIAGAAPEIVVLIFGAEFAPAAPALALLIFGAVVAVLIYVGAAILTAAGKPGWVLAVTWAMPVLAIGGHLFLIPRLGLLGAAAVTAGLSFLGALAAVSAVYRIWRITPPAGTVARSLPICLLVYVLAAGWTTSGLLLLVKLSGLVVLILAAFLLSGEFRRSEVSAALSFLLGKPLRGEEQVET